jgi:hypothetical protein
MTCDLKWFTNGFLQLVCLANKWGKDNKLCIFMISWVTLRKFWIYGYNYSLESTKLITCSSNCFKPAFVSPLRLVVGSFSFNAL